MFRLLFRSLLGRLPHRRTRPDRRHQILVGAVAAGLLVIAGLTAVTLPAASAPFDPCGAAGNKISCENSKPGTPRSVWEVTGAGAASIQGFATDISVNVGQRIDFKIDTNASNYGITIYRSGFYGGSGARQIATVTPSAKLPQSQPQCITEASTELYDCGNWAVSASWTVPATAVSGVYFARLYRADQDAASMVTFIVRDDSSRSDLVFQTSDTTWQAYNTYGGSNFYQGAANGRAYKVSYNRPVLTRDGIGGRDFYFANEYPLVRFLEKNGYDVSYIAGVDTDRAGALLKNHKTFLSVGHDEYWSKTQRANVESARDAGVNLMFLSGNEVYWKTRYEPSADSSRTDYRTLVSYKETWANAKIDPSDEWTGTWRDPRFAPPSKGGGTPENKLTGTQFQANHDDLAVTVSAEEGKLRLWRNTNLATMGTGSSKVLAPHTVGYESDEDVDNGSRPNGLIRLSTTTGSTPQYLQDFGSTVVPGSTTHHLTMYRAPSGALVFGAGTIQWTWGLDTVHDSAFAPEPADARMQQAQVNLLADMGSSPTTLGGGLVAAVRSTDTTSPVTTISAPVVGSAQANGSKVTLSGSATDVGGRVAGVEVSTNGGQSWSAATGTSSWTYSYVQHGLGSTPVSVRAIDDSANIGATVTSSFAVACPCSVFGATVPSTPAAADASAVELGMRFTTLTDGFVSGVRFYKGTGNTGTHTGSLWSTAGQRLATVTFANETATGWQQASFSSAVAVAAGERYVVSYSAPNGRYAVLKDGFSSAPTDAWPLSVEGGYGAQPAGLFGTPTTFPTRSFANSTYYVDPLFTTTDDSPLRATNQLPLPDSSSVPWNTKVSAKFSKPIVSGTASLTLIDALGATVAGATTYDSTSRTVTFTPSAELARFVKYTATVSATDSSGQQVTTGKTWSFTTARPPSAPGTCPCTLFDDTTVPTVLDSGETSPLSLGVRFSSSSAGTITGLRFYKGPKNTGTHTGSLWSLTGTELATGTFTGESSSGWQTLVFAQPYPIKAGTEYVVSYRSPTGSYSLTPNAFAAGDLSRPPLRVASDSGAYTYGSGYPGGTSANNYLVDPVFEPAPAAISVTSLDPPDGALGVLRGTSISATFSSALASGYSVTVTQAGAPVSGTTSLGSGGAKLTFVPSSALAKDVLVEVTISGVVGTNGATLPPVKWSFRTANSDVTAREQTLMGDESPTVAAAADGASIELGTAFTPGASGQVTGVRFFKGTGNDGTHTGSLWNATGTRLATVTFSGETASGWQTAKFAQPVQVVEGATYVVSYLAPLGHYSYTSGYFAQPKVSGDLTAPATNNGRYVYGTGGTVPVNSFNATNYFVDTIFVADPPSVSVTARKPAPDATGVDRATTVSITFDKAVLASVTIDVRQAGAAVAGTSALSGDQKTLTFTPSASLPSDALIEVSVSGIQTAAGATLPNQSWSFRTEAGVTTTLFGNQTPSVSSADDGSAIELGTAFSSSVDGTVTAIRFYQGAGNTGTHTGSIWSSSGNRLGTVTFAGETGSGWQTATLATPVALSAGQTYVVSYYAPNGHYAATPGYFSSPYSSGPLSTPTNDNGRYLYGSGGGFPTSSWNATNYFVDVVFRSAGP